MSVDDQTTGLGPIFRLSRDLKKAAQTMSAKNARFLVDDYYILQEGRKRANNQILSMEGDSETPEEPHSVLVWLAEQSETLEAQIKRALDAYADAQPVGKWLKCAPPGTKVLKSSGRWSTGESVPIEELQDGDTIPGFDRRRARLSWPVPVKVESMQFSGDLLRVGTADDSTLVTPNHKWLVQIDENSELAFVYLMRSNGRYRIGRVRAIHSPTMRRKNGRMALRMRGRQEGTDDTWILRICDDKREATIYESMLSAKYGIPTCRFVATGSTGLLDQDALDKIFDGLDPIEQEQRAMKCLLDHARCGELSFFAGSNRGTKETVAGLIVHSCNLVPELMRIPVPIRGGGIEWRTLKKIERVPYTGPVFSLNVAKHHKYIQDGMATCNSQYGIGPVIAAGLMAHIDITKCPTAGHIWSFGGYDPRAVWNKGERRPWNADLKTLQWKAGQSFCKFSNADECHYGKLYKHRKQYELDRNERGDNAEVAAQTLKDKNFGKKTEAFKHLSGGKLPPAQIDARARRWAVKIFLSHLHMVWYFIEFGRMPVKPYPVAIGGHAHLMVPQHQELVPGLTEAIRNWH